MTAPLMDARSSNGPDSPNVPLNKNDDNANGFILIVDELLIDMV